MTLDKPAWPDIHAGAIPWTTDGFYAARDEHLRLLRTPHDDWSRGPLSRPIPLDAPEELRMPALARVDSIENQMWRYFCRTHPAASVTVVLSHFKRYFMIVEFLDGHFEQLRTDGLVVTPKSGDLWYSTVLIEVVAFVRYEARGPDRAGDERPIFNYGRVVRVAKQILANPEGDLV